MLISRLDARRTRIRLVMAFGLAAMRRFRPGARPGDRDAATARRGLDGAAQVVPQTGPGGQRRPALPGRLDHPGLERRQENVGPILRAAQRGQLRHRRRPDPARPLADPERRAQGHRAQGGRAHDRHQQRQRRTRPTRSPRESPPSSHELRERLPKTKVLLARRFPAGPKARRRFASG